MKTTSPLIFLALCFLITSTEAQKTPPSPYGKIPSPRQISWHERERYCFLHFTTTTFTDKEWGEGSEPANLFNPTAFDADQIISTMARNGFKGAILTCKHHDGFCLWPTATTDHSVKNSTWKNGKGDVVKEISEACKKYKISFGVYLSPWDRNNALYGKKEYIDVYRRQLTELLTQYGDIFEVWFDGANGGTGYYGGANEARTIDRNTYYDWPNTFSIVRKLQPMASIFSDVGPDIRWCGNESGYVQDSCWATYKAKGPNNAPPNVGFTEYKTGETGTREEGEWIPPECDVSIRPGWFYHANEDDKVRHLNKRVGKMLSLKELYFKSIGNGANLNLNIPPDRKGQLHPNDVAALDSMGNFIKKSFSHNLLKNASVSVSAFRGNEKKFAGQNVLDEDKNSYWALNDNQKEGWLLFKCKSPVSFNCLEIREYIPLGQRVLSFVIEVRQGGRWKEVFKGSTIGYKKLALFKSVTSDAVRLSVKSSACPVIESVRLYQVEE